MLEFNSEQKEYTTTTLLNDENKKFELKTVSQFYQELIEQCKSNDKCGNRLIYKSSYNSLKVFTKTNQIYRSAQQMYRGLTNMRNGCVPKAIKKQP